MIRALASELHSRRRLAEESPPSPPAPTKRQRLVAVDDDDDATVASEETNAWMELTSSEMNDDDDSSSIFMRRVFTMNGDRAAALRRRTDDDPNADYISYDPNRVMLSRRSATSSTREEEDEEDQYRNIDENVVSQFPSGRRRAREFDPRAWRFGRSYAVPEQTSARYLCLGENRKSLLSRLIVRYHRRTNGEEEEEGEEKEEEKAQEEDGHWLSLADALRAINSPARRLTIWSKLPVRRYEITVLEPFELLTVVRPAEKSRPEFVSALIRVLLASGAIARNWYVTYDDVLSHYYRRHRHHHYRASSRDTPEWRNLEIVDFAKQLRRCAITYENEVEKDGDATAAAADCEKHHAPHILLACPIEPLEEWPPMFETDDDDLSPSTRVPPPPSKETTTTLPTSDRYGADRRPIDFKAYFATPSFADDKSLHVWLNVEIRQFYERLLPVLLCRLPHFSAYDRSCVTQCENWSASGVGRVGGSVRRASRNGASSCICVQLCDYRAALTNSIIRIVLHRLVFDLRYNANLLPRFVSRERSSRLFERLMTNGFACAALPFSYFVDAEVVVRRCRELHERIRRSPSFSLFLLAAAPLSSGSCSCHRDMLRLSNEALSHMIAVRTTAAAVNSPWRERFRADDDENNEHNDAVSFNCRYRCVASGVKWIRDRAFTDNPSSDSYDLSSSSSLSSSDSDCCWDEASKSLVSSSLRTIALRAAILAHGLAEVLDLTNVVNMPADVIARSEVYFRETVWYFLRRTLWESIVLQRAHSNDFVHRFPPFLLPWWRRRARERAREQRCVALGEENGTGVVVNVREIVRPINLLEQKDYSSAAAAPSRFAVRDELAVRRSSYDWIRHGCRRSRRDGSIVSCTAQRFPIAHRFDSATYDSALRYAHESRLFVPEVNDLFVVYDDRRNFALLATLTRETVSEHYRREFSRRAQTSSSTVVRPKGFVSPTETFSTIYATRLYVLKTSSHLERTMLAICRGYGRSKDDEDDDDDGDNGENVFIPSGRVVLGDAATIVSSQQRRRPRHVLHRDAIALPELLHENHAWLWLAMTANDFAQWFRFARRRMRRLSALETDRSRTALPRFRNATTTGCRCYCCDTSPTLEQRRAFATSFWHAAHNTVAFAVIVYARVRRYPTEATELFCDIAKWSWWYSPPIVFRSPPYVFVDDRDYNNDDFRRRAQRRHSTNEFGRGPRTDAWTLALAALFVGRRDFWLALTRFMQIAIGELKLVTIQRDGPLEGYSMLNEKLRVEIERNVGWLARRRRRVTLVVYDDDDEDDEDDYSDHYRHDVSTDMENSNSDDDEDNDDWYKDHRRYDDDDYSDHTVNSNDGDDRGDNDSDDADNNSESSDFDDDNPLLAFDRAIDSWTRKSFVRETRLAGDSVVCRALDCIFVLRGIYRDVRDDSLSSSRRIVSPLNTIDGDDDDEYDNDDDDDDAIGNNEDNVSSSRFCCREYRDAWNGQLCEFVDERESAFRELAESTTEDFARLVRRVGISAALTDDWSTHEARCCQRYFSRVFWWFVSTVFNFHRDLCIRCYE